MAISIANNEDAAYDHLDQARFEPTEQSVRYIEERPDQHRTHETIVFWKTLSEDLGKKAVNNTNSPMGEQYYSD